MPTPTDEDADEGVEVTDAEWAALMEASESVRQGNTVDAETVLAKLGKRVTSDRAAATPRE